MRDLPTHFASPAHKAGGSTTRQEKPSVTENETVRNPKNLPDAPAMTASARFSCLENLL